MPFSALISKWGNFIIKNKRIRFINKKNEITNSDNVEKSKYIDEITEKWNMNHTILNIFKNKMIFERFIGYLLYNIHQNNIEIAEEICYNKHD